MLEMTVSANTSTHGQKINPISEVYWNKALIVLLIFLESSFLDPPAAEHWMIP